MYKPLFDKKSVVCKEIPISYTNKVHFKTQNLIFPIQINKDFLICPRLYKSKISLKTYTFVINFFKKSLSILLMQKPLFEKKFTV